jgi:Na+-translocating ferredoxin:NAD+ oxidoreductase RnfD subunit
MLPERTALCHGLAVVTGFLTYVGALIIEGLATGDVARALQREAVDVASYWWFALPVCYLVAGLLGYLGPARTWRWSLDMLATHAVCMLLFADSGLNLWPFALLLALLLALPGMLTAWFGGVVHRRTALRAADR